jgi:hypothetical protein
MVRIRVGSSTSDAEKPAIGPTAKNAISSEQNAISKSSVARLNRIPREMVSSGQAALRDRQVGAREHNR